MRDMKIGDIIRERRKNLNLTQEQLCEGICEPLTLSRIENGKAVPTYSHLRALLSRLGLPEGRYFVQERANEDAIRMIRHKLHTLSGYYDAAIDRSALSARALSLIGQLEDMLSAQDIPDLQFAVYMKVYFHRDPSDAPLYADLCEQLLSAIRLSLPRFTMETISEGVYSLEETQMIVLLGEILRRMGEQEKALTVLHDIHQYVQDHVHSITHPSRFLPLTAVTYAKALCQSGNYEQALDLSQEGIHCCLQYGYCGQLPYLLETEAFCLEQLDQLALADTAWKESYALFSATGNERGMLRTAEKIRQDQPLLSAGPVVLKLAQSLQSIPEGSLSTPDASPSPAQSDKPRHLGAIIRERREELGFSQPALCAGLCTPMTLSRFERGEQMPPWYIVLPMVQRLGLPDDLFFSGLTEEEIRIHLLRKNITGYCFQYEVATDSEKKELRGAALRDIAEIKNSNAYKSSEMRQFIEHSEISIDDPAARSHSEKIQALEAALRRTIPAFSIDTIRSGVYSSEEAELIMLIATEYSESGKQDVAIDILDQLQKCIVRKYPEWHLFLAVTYNLAVNLGGACRYSDALRAATDGLSACLQREHYAMIPGFLHIQAECYYCMQETSLAQALYPVIWNLYQLIQDSTNAELLKQDADDRFQMTF